MKKYFHYYSITCSCLNSSRDYNEFFAQLKYFDVNLHKYQKYENFDKKNFEKFLRNF